MSRRPRAPEQRTIARMFDEIVPTYDRLNALMSGGQDRRWRKLAAGELGTRGGRVLDLGCGTGRLGDLLSGDNLVVGVDVSAGMLAEARRSAGGRLLLVSGSAFALPFRSGAFDGLASAFALRNLDDLAVAFSECARVLRPGGRIALIDVTEPPNRAWRVLFDTYFKAAAPLLGRIVGHRDAYSYLPRSLIHLPPAPEVVGLLETAGFTGVRTVPRLGGAVTLWSAVRR